VLTRDGQFLTSVIPSDVSPVISSGAEGGVEKSKEEVLREAFPNLTTL